MRNVVADFIERNRLISPSERVLVGVSGGGDSVALLHILHSLASRMGFSLCAAHLNHGIRGVAAEEDAAFVRDICDFYGVRVFGGYADIPALARRSGQTLEQAGRGVRYDFLEEARRFFGADSIAVAHHRDDQVESILMHLLRGSGLRGLCGMTPKRGDVIRPLLCLSRADIERYLTEEGLPFRTDETNFITDGTRNRLRLEAVPYLKNAFNPRFSETLCSMGELLSEDEEYLCALAHEQLERAKRDGGYDRFALAELPRPILSRCIREALSLAGAATDVERIHTEAVMALLEGRTGARLTLPGADAWTSYGLICFGKYPKYDEKWELPFLLEGETVTPRGVFVAEPCDPSLRPEDLYTACMDMSALGEGAVVRCRRNGDRFRPVNAPGDRKLKDVFIDRKIPRPQRELPLIARGSRVLFVPGLGIAEEVKLTRNTARAVRVKYIQADQEG